MVAQSRSRSPHRRQCPTTGPHAPRSDCDCNATRGVSTSPASIGATSSTLTWPIPNSQYQPCSTASFASTPPTGTPPQQPSRRETDKQRTPGPSPDITSSSSSHPNVYLETDATPDAEGDTDISNLSGVYVRPDSELGLPLVPVSAEENIWGSSASVNGTSCLPAHTRGPLSPANIGSHHPSASASISATTTATSTAAASHPGIAAVMPGGSSDASTTSSRTAAGAATVAEYERDTYHYHKARTAANVPVPSPSTPTASSAPKPTTTHTDQPSETPSLTGPQGCYTAHSCAEPTSRLDVRSRDRDDAGTRSGTGTPAALDTPAFRTPLGVYNGFVHDHERRSDNEGYFLSSSSSISSVISAVSVQLQDETKSRLQQQKRPPLRHFPALARGVQGEETSPKQTLSLLALPMELVAHILRMGYFSPPVHAKLSSDLNTLSASTSSAPAITSSSAPAAPSRLYTSTNPAGVQGDYFASSEDESSSTTADDLRDEDDTPPTITSDPHLRLALLHTCRALRAAVFADPALWSVIRLGPGDGEGGVRRALGASPFAGHLPAGLAERDVKASDKTYLGHQLALARAHPLRISLTAFWGRSECVEGEEEVDVSQRVFALLAGAGGPSGALTDAAHGLEARTGRWEAFELVCPREDEWAVLARVTARRAFPTLRYLSLTFVGRASGSSIPLPAATPGSAPGQRRRAAAAAADARRRHARGAPRERRARDGRPGARHSVALPAGAFGGWRAGALPCLRGLLLRGVDLEGVVEDVLAHEYETPGDAEDEPVGLDDPLPADVFGVHPGAVVDPPEPALPALRTLDVRGHGLWPDAAALDAFFTSHALALRRLGVHVRSGDVLRAVAGRDALNSASLVPAAAARLCIPSLRVLEVDTSSGLNRDTARMVRLLSGAAVSESESESEAGGGGRSEMRRIVVRESGGAAGEELLRWSCAWPGTAGAPDARLAITNSTISSALGALPPAMLAPVRVLVLDVPAGEGGWGEARRLRHLLAVFGQGDGGASRQLGNEADGLGLGRLRRVEVLNADALGIVREVLAQPRMSTSEFEFEHDEAGDEEEEDEDGWERFLSSTGMAEPLCAAQELVISFSETGSAGEDVDDPKISNATVALVSLFTGSGRPETSTSRHTSLKRVILKGPTHSQVTAVVRSLNGEEYAAFDGPQIRVQDIRL